MDNSKTDQPLDSIKDGVRGLVEHGQERVNALKARVVKTKDRAVTKGSAYLDRTIELIKAHPVQAVGLAFGIGYLGMRLFRR